MRVDRFLKMARIVKRRSLAQEMIAHGAVRVGKSEVRPSRDLKPGDIVEVAFPRKVLTLKVTTVEESELKRGVCAFDIIEERHVSGEERPW